MAKCMRCGTDGLEWWGFSQDNRRHLFRKLYRIVKGRLPRPGEFYHSALDLGAGRGIMVSLLSDSGIVKVTCVERDEQAVEWLRLLESEGACPEIEVVHGDVNELDDLVPAAKRFDLVTMLFTAQYLQREELLQLLVLLRSRVRKKVIMDVANRYSLYRWWCSFRGFESDYQSVFPIGPGEFEELCRGAGFKVTFRKGVGLLMPLSLLSRQRLTLVPVWLSSLVSKLDFLLPRLCQNYCVELVPSGFECHCTVEELQPWSEYLAVHKLGRLIPKEVEREYLCGWDPSVGHDRSVRRLSFREDSYLPWDGEDA